MKIQNNKTKTVTTIITALVIGLVMSSPTVMLPNVGAVTSDILSQDCIDKAGKIELQLGSQLDEAKAKSIASSHNEFASRTLGKSIAFDSMFNTWTIDKTTCNPTLNTTNVVYDVSDTNGKNMHKLVFAIDPQLTKVTRIDDYNTQTSYTPSTYYNNIHAGYEFAGDATLTTTVTNAYASFSAPSVSKPSGFNCYLSSSTPDCRLAVWTGLQDNYGGPALYLVQTGIVVIDSCDASGSGCIQSGNMWYQYQYPGGQSGGTPCGSVSAGHSISATVTQDSVNPLKYNTRITNANTGISCTASLTTSMNSPRVSNFIDERPTISVNGGPQMITPLPLFSTNSISGGQTLRGTTTQSMYVPYSSGYYQNDRMTTDGTSGTHELITESLVDNTGSFTWTYHFSS